VPSPLLISAAVLAAIGLGLGPSGAGASPPWPASLGYVLQAEHLGDGRGEAVSRLAASGRDLLVLDAAFTAGEGGQWTREELDAIRAGRLGRQVVCYLSIGEAERYRDYWPAIAGGEVVLDENPDWPGNYKVRFWREDWQRIIDARVAAIAAQGFDGVYLDIVDAFQHFEHDPDGSFHPGRVNPETGRSYRADMAAFVLRIAAGLRAARPGALVIPQNGSELLREPEFHATVNGIGVEDLFTLGDESQHPEHTRQVLDNLAALDDRRHFVLEIEYAESGAQRSRAVRLAGEHGHVLLLTDRALTTLGTSYAPVRWR